MQDGAESNGLALFMEGDFSPRGFDGAVFGLSLRTRPL